MTDQIELFAGVCFAFAFIFVIDSLMADYWCKMGIVFPIWPSLLFAVMLGAIVALMWSLDLVKEAKKEDG